MKKKFEFSKVIAAILIVAFIFAFLLSAFVIIMNAFGIGISDGLTPFLGFVGAVVSAGLSFYFWKAKNENLSKYGNANELEDTDAQGFIVGFDGDGVPRVHGDPDEESLG